MHPSGAYLTHVALPALQWSTGSIQLRTQNQLWLLDNSQVTYVCILMINSQTEKFLRSSLILVMNCYSSEREGCAAFLIYNSIIL